MVEKINKSLRQKKSQIQTLKNKNEELEKENKDLNDKLERTRARNLAAKAQITLKQTKRDVKEVGEKYTKGIDSIGAKAKAAAEITADRSRDIMSSTKELMGALISDESPIKKVTTVAKDVGNITKNVGSIVSGGGVEEKIKQLKEEGRSLIEERKRFETVANNSKRSDIDRERAKKRIEKINKQIANIHVELKKLKN